MTVNFFFKSWPEDTNKDMTTFLKDDDGGKPSAMDDDSITSSAGAAAAAGLFGRKRSAVDTTKNAATASKTPRISTTVNDAPNIRVAVIGSKGVGKTTVVHALLGMDRVPNTAADSIHTYRLAKSGGAETVIHQPRIHNMGEDVVTEHVHCVNSRPPFLNVRHVPSGMIVDILDIPGIDGSVTRSKYKAFVTSQWLTFDVVIIVVDAYEGEKEREDVLMLVLQNLKAIKAVELIILYNKVDHSDGMNVRDYAAAMRYHYGDAEKLIRKPLVVCAVSAIKAFLHRYGPQLTFEEFCQVKTDAYESVGKQFYGSRQWERLRDNKKKEKFWLPLAKPELYNVGLLEHVGTTSHFKNFEERLNSMIEKGNYLRTHHVEAAHGAAPSNAHGAGADLHGSTPGSVGGSVDVDVPAPGVSQVTNLPTLTVPQASTTSYRYSENIMLGTHVGKTPRCPTCPKWPVKDNGYFEKDEPLCCMDCFSERTTATGDDPSRRKNARASFNRLPTEHDCEAVHPCVKTGAQRVACALPRPTKRVLHAPQVTRFLLYKAHCRSYQGDVRETTAAGFVAKDKRAFTSNGVKGIMEEWINWALENERDRHLKKEYFRKDNNCDQPVTDETRQKLWDDAIKILRRLLTQIRAPTFVEGLNRVLPRYHNAQWINAVYLWMHGSGWNDLPEEMRAVFPQIDEEVMLSG